MKNIFEWASEKFWTWGEDIDMRTEGTWWSFQGANGKTHLSYIWADGKPFFLHHQAVIVTEIQGDPTGKKVATIYLSSPDPHVYEKEGPFQIEWENGKPKEYRHAERLNHYMTIDGVILPWSIVESLQYEQAGITSRAWAFYLMKHPTELGIVQVVDAISTTQGGTVYEVVRIEGVPMKPIEYSGNLTHRITLCKDKICFWDGKLILWNSEENQFKIYTQNGIVFDNVQWWYTERGMSSEYSCTALLPNGKEMAVYITWKTLKTIQWYFATPIRATWYNEIQYGPKKVILDSRERSIPWEEGAKLYPQFDQSGVHIGWVWLIPEPDENNQEIREDDISKLGGKDEILVTQFPDREGKIIKSFWMKGAEISKGVFLYYSSSFGLRNKLEFQGNNTSRYRFFRIWEDGNMKFAFNDNYNITFLPWSNDIQIISNAHGNSSYTIRFREWTKSVFDPIGTYEGDDVLLAQNSQGKEVYIRIIRDYANCSVVRIEEIKKDNIDGSIHGITLSKKGKIILEGVSYDIDYSDNNHRDSAVWLDDFYMFDFVLGRNISYILCNERIS